MRLRLSRARNQLESVTSTDSVFSQRHSQKEHLSKTES